MINKIFVLLSILFLGCNPRVLKNVFESDHPSRVKLDYEPFAFIEKQSDTLRLVNKKKIGNIEIKDAGLTFDCSYPSIKILAKKEALSLGGNCLFITEHRTPNQWTTCHRIKADIFIIENAKDFENKIMWHKNRKLEISDFKGSTEKRPFQASTSSGFKYQYWGRPALPKKYKLEVETYFDCTTSYFKLSEYDSTVLAHEQIHFDISELYSRKFIKRIQEQAQNLFEVEAKHESISNEITKELHLKQDEYDSEVYSDRSLQSKWNQWIEKELDQHSQYSTKTLIIKPQK